MFRVNTCTAACSALFVIWAGIRSADAYGELDRFLIVSSSSTHQIAYAPIPQDMSTGDVKLRTLIDHGLTFPQGLAVDPWRRHLYVADPSLNQLVYYVLEPKSSDRLYVGNQKVAAAAQEVRWVAVDSMGNVFFTVEGMQRVMKISAEKLDKGDTAATILYEGSSNNMVSAPGGIAADNYFAYWTNKMDPATAGTVVQSYHSKDLGKSKEMLKFNAKTYGICLAENNLFFSDETGKVYGIPRLGGLETPAVISAQFEEARGLAFDGQSVVYVADKKKNAIYSFPGAMPILRTDIAVSKIADMEGAYGIAVYSVSQSGGALGLTPSWIASAVLPAVAALLAMISASL